MCKSKKMTANVIQPSRQSPSTSTKPSRKDTKQFNQSTTTSSTNLNHTSTNYSSRPTKPNSSYKDSSAYFGTTDSLIDSTKVSLPGLRQTLSSDHAQLYDFSEILFATNNFLSHRHSSTSTSASWRCTIRGTNVIVLQRKLRRAITSSDLANRLSLLGKCHYSSVIKLRGASISGNYIYLVYDYIHGCSLADCLRNTRNKGFTLLSSWISRIQIATDLAHGLDYIHHSTGLNLNFVHNHIKSSSILITEPSLNAMICHFGTAQLSGESDTSFSDSLTPTTEIPAENLAQKTDTTNDKSSACGAETRKHRETKTIKRSDSRGMKFQGTRGYMSPEYQSFGVATQKSDVYAFGVVILELVSGEEPLKYIFSDENGGGYVRISVINTAKAALAAADSGALRRWVDKRLRDSYPEEVVENLTRVGLECVEEDPSKRPDMSRVAGRVSKLFLESMTWSEKMGVPSEFISVSFAPR